MAKPRRLLHVGDVVRLEDARGCWCLHEVRELDTLIGDVFYRSGVTWRRMPFTLADTTDEDGRPILRSSQPAIGPRHAPYRRLHLPDGWQPPSDVIDCGIVQL